MRHQVVIEPYYLGPWDTKDVSKEWILLSETRKWSLKTESECIYAEMIGYPAFTLGHISPFNVFPQLESTILFFWVPLNSWKMKNKKWKKSRCRKRPDLIFCWKMRKYLPTPCHAMQMYPIPSYKQTPASPFSSPSSSINCHTPSTS